jgi:hypothetical protein
VRIPFSSVPFFGAVAASASEAIDLTEERKKEWIASSRSLLARTAERHRAILPNAHA